MTDVSPGVTIRPADVTNRRGQGAEPGDAFEEPQAAVAHDETAADLEPHLRADPWCHYARPNRLMVSARTVTLSGISRSHAGTGG